MHVRLSSQSSTKKTPSTAARVARGATTTVASSSSPVTPPAPCGTSRGMLHIISDMLVCHRGTLKSWFTPTGVLYSKFEYGQGIWLGRYLLVSMNSLDPLRDALLALAKDLDEVDRGIRKPSIDYTKSRR